MAKSNFPHWLRQFVTVAVLVLGNRVGAANAQRPKIEWLTKQGSLIISEAKITCLRSGGYAIASFDDTVKAVGNLHAPAYRFVLKKVNSDGTTRWIRHYPDGGGVGPDVQAIEESENGDLLVVASQGGASSQLCEIARYDSPGTGGIRQQCYNDVLQAMTDAGAGLKPANGQLLDPKEGLSIALAGNPGRGATSLLISGMSGRTASVKVFNLLGEQVIGTELAVHNDRESVPLSFSQLPAGQYMISVTSEIGERAGTVFTNEK